MSQLGGAGEAGSKQQARAPGSERERDVDCFRERRRIFTSTSGARPSVTPGGQANRTFSAEITTTLSLFAAGGVADMFDV